MSNEIIQEAKNLISGKKDEDARVLLLEKGFWTKSDKTIQQAYFDLFPPAPELQHELNGSLKGLTDPDKKVREKAAAFINKQSRGDLNIKQRAWLRDPRTIEILLGALNDQSEKVVYEITIALGMIVQRYKYPDLNIYHTLTQKFKSSSDEIKIKIAQAISSFDIPGKWDYILQALQCKPSKTARHATGLTVSRYGTEMDLQAKATFSDEMMKAFKDEKDFDARISLIKGLSAIGDQSTASALKSEVKLEKEKVLVKEIEYAIKSIESR